MQKLTIKIDKHPELKNTYIAHFNGAFDGSINEPLEELESLIKNQSETCNNFVLDFEDLIYLNSYAIGQLVNWHNLLAKNCGKIVILHANKEVGEIFRILGISNLFSIFSSLEEAEAFIKSKQTS